MLAELPNYWSSESSLRFAVFVGIALLTSAWKVALPGVRGTMSMNFLFVLVGIVQLSPSETLAMSALAVLVQSCYHAKARGADRWIKAAFNVGSVAIAVRAATFTYAVITPTFPALEFPFRLALTATVYFLCNTVPVSIIISLTENKSLIANWRTCFFWSLPYYLIGAAISGLLYAVKATAGWQTSVLLVPIVYVVYRSYLNYLERLQAEKNQAEAERNQAEIQRNHAEEIAALHLRTISALALAIEAKDHTTHEHLQRVQVYCMEVGKELGMNESDLQALLAASLLHDIGKLAVPEHIISKPGKLTPEEFEKMKIHPVVGAEILESVRFPYPVVPIVRHHHEKWDGSGYPDGIRGEDIPLGARILSAVDCFDALSSDRQYRRALPVAESMAYLEKEVGRAFDKRVVEVMARRYVELEAMAREHSEEANTKLSINAKIHRGAAPDAGFAEEGAPHHVEHVEFVGSIASARAEAQLLFSISQNLTLNADGPAILLGFGDRLRTIIPFDTIAYYHLDGEVLCPLFVSGKEEDFFRLRIPVGQGLSGWVAHEKKTILNGNPAVEPGFLNDRNAVTNLRSALAVPVEGESGVIGVLALYSAKRDQFTRDHLRIVMAVAARLAHQVENFMRFQKVSGDATTDELTGLHNSRWLVTALESACANARDEEPELAIVVLDLDGFKALNDTFGHLRGNQALRDIAARSTTILSEGTTIARMGGDEFLLLVTRGGHATATALAARIQTEIEQIGVDLFGEKRLSASWGVSVSGADGHTPEALIAEADRRMYENKRSKNYRMTSSLSQMAVGIAAREQSEVVVEAEPAATIRN